MTASSSRRRLAALAAAVLAAHLAALEGIASADLAGGGRAVTIAPLDVAFVRELQPQAPPAAAPRPPVAAHLAPATHAASAPPRRTGASTPAPPGRRASAPRGRPAEAASASVRSTLQPQPRPSSPEPPQAPTAPDPPPADAGSEAVLADATPADPTPAAAMVVTAAVPAASAASAPAAPAAPAAAAAAVAANDEPPGGPPASPAGAAPSAAQALPAAPGTARVATVWPASTRLDYALEGHYRGPIAGHARVDWVRVGERYQVRLSSTVSTWMRRDAVSEGVVTDDGLAPRRFVAEQSMPFMAARRWTLGFDDGRVRLADGRDVPAPAGVQDEASQFVQLAWLFNVAPQRLRVGESVELPLALSRRVLAQRYGVVAAETLSLPFGQVPTLRLAPQHAPAAGELAAEVWLAPTLQSLPVRIVVRQSAENFVDMRLARPPRQAAE